MPRTRFVVAVVLAAVMVLSAGCAGFGTDGPADPSEVPDGDADDQENESSINETEATNESSEESDGDSNEYNETDPPESSEESDEDDPDESPAVGGSDDGGSADETEGTDSTGDTEEGDDAGSGTNSGQEGTSSSDDGNGDAANDGNGDDAPSENGGDGDGGEDSPESGDENADGGDGGDAGNGESGEKERVYTLTVEADSPVTLERTWEDASTTREPTNGTVEFSVIEGSYTLSADGYHDVPEELAIQVDSDTTVTLQSEDGGEIEVNVVDAETGEPIEGAEISGVCDWYYSSGDVHVTGETDADGVATAYAELAPTDCDATVSAEGYESESVALSVPDDDGVTVELEPEGSE